MKRVISIILLICMVMTIFPADVPTAAQDLTWNTLTDRTNPFTDVSESDWFYDAVLYVFDNGIFKGTGETTFSPYGTMTRAMYVTVLGRIAGVDPVKYSGISGFTDVDANAYYAPYVAWAVEKGITIGVGNNCFEPDGLVNREQMAVFTVRYFEACGIKYSTDSEVTSTPKDIYDVSPWARDSVLKLWQAGLFQGDNNGLFNPKTNAIRAMAATFFMRTNPYVNASREETGEPFPTPTPSPSPSPSPAPGNEGNITYHTVSFNSNGGDATDPITVRSGDKLPSLPAPKKENAIFLGWYQDPGLLENQFTDGSVVTSNITLHAKYLDIEDISEEEVNDSFSLADQEPKLKFYLSSLDSNMTIEQVKAALTLEVADGSDPVELTVSGSIGSFIVSAANGFTEGASYKLTLANPKLSFIDRGPHARYCSFTIKKAEVFNLELNNGIVYIPDAHVKNIIKDNAQVGFLSVPLATMTGDESGADTSTTGSFTYTGNETISIGDVLCIYSGQRPEPGDDAAYLNDDIAYIKVIGISGDTISFSGADPEDVLFIPDMLPIYVGEGHTLTDYINNGQTGSFKTSLFDLGFENFTELGLSADTTIDVGDYLILSLKYGNEGDSEEEVDENDTAYAEVTSVKTTGTMVEVAFMAITQDEMQNARGYYSQNDLDGEQMLGGIDIEMLERQITDQVVQSGFADKAASYLTTLAMSTDGFKEIAEINGGMESLRISMADGSAISANQFGLMAQDAKKIKIKDKKVSAKINQKPKNFDKGVHCEISVELIIQIRAGDDSVIEIKLNANFVEEIKITVNASGSEVWSNKKVKVGFVKINIPYISDYSMNANIDIYNYTAINFKASVSTRGDINSIDVSKQIQKLLGNNDKKEITNGVKELYEIYSDMMANGTDWVEIFDQEIVSIPISLVWGVIQARVTVNFTAAANINVAIGCNYESKSGTRYCFWAKLKAHDIGTSTVDLMDETYTFQFYVMGILGLRTGIKLEVAVGLFSLSLDSVGIEAEAGIFTRLYGFFFYEKKLLNNKVTSNKSGALYFELGAYLEVALTAQVLNGKFKSSLDVLDKEWTLLTAGQRYNVFDFAYENPENIIFTDKMKTFTIPENTFNMTYLDLREGESSDKTYKIGDFIINFSDNRFSLVDGKIEANIPSSIRYLECDMTVTWKHSPLAFSSVPISCTYKLIWDTLVKSGYTIYFESNGGGAVKSITKKYGESVSAPKAPAKTGYTFGGWYTDKALKNAYTFSTMGWDDVFLYAKWTPNNNTKYKVEHYQQDITNSDKYTLKENQNLTGTTDTNVSPAVKSYLGFKSPVKQTVKIAADGSTVVEYKYTRNSYKVTFAPDNGESSIVQTLKYGMAIKPPMLKKTGYTFADWDKAVASTMPAEDLTYKALWKKNTYIVTFDSNGGSNPSSITVTYGNTYGALPQPEREGYAFHGWYTNEVDDVGFGTRVESGNMVTITSPQILYAKWAGKPTKYSVEHYLQNTNDSSYPENPFEIQELTGNAGTEVKPEVKAYPGIIAPLIKTVTIAGNGSTVVKYYYTRNSYTLTFKPENGSEDIVSTIKFGAAIALPEGLTKLGYTLTGWSPEPTGVMPAEDMTYTAIWTANNDIAYRVEHYKEDLDGNYSLADTDNLQGTADASVTPATKDYKGFTAPGTEPVTILADGSTMVKYYYTRNSYKLIFDANEGEGGNSEWVKYGAEITLTPPEVTREGYTLVDWDPVPSIPFVMPANDVIYTAIWEGNKYTVTLDPNEGTGLDTIEIEVTYGLPYGDLPIPARSGLRFIGWFDSEFEDNGTGTQITSLTTVSTTSNHILYAKWDSTNPEELAAMEAVELAEITQSHNDFLAALGLVNAIEDTVLKVELQTRLDAIVVIYNLSLDSGQIIIYSDHYTYKGFRTDYANGKFKFIITGRGYGDTPLRVYNTTSSPVTYDITLRDVTMVSDFQATAFLIDHNDGSAQYSKPENLVVNLTIDGIVSIEASNHPGIQSEGNSTVNLKGTKGSSFYSDNTFGPNNRAISQDIKLSIDTTTIYEMRVGYIVTSNITDAQKNKPLEITFK